MTTAEPEKKLKCITCGKEITNQKGSVIMDCPSCDKHKIIRCFHCREIAARYTCGNCGFSGPN